MTFPAVGSRPTACASRTGACGRAPASSRPALAVACAPCAGRADARTRSRSRGVVVAVLRDRIRVCLPRWARTSSHVVHRRPFQFVSQMVRRVLRRSLVTPTATRCGSCLRGPPPRVGLRPCWGRRSVSRGPAALQTRRHLRASQHFLRVRKPSLRARPHTENSRRSRPLVAPPCSAWRLRAASRRAARDHVEQRASPARAGVTGGHGSVLPRVREGGHYRADTVPESQSTSPVSQ